MTGETLCGPAPARELPLARLAEWLVMDREHPRQPGLNQRRYKLACGHTVSLLLATTEEATEYIYGCTWELGWTGKSGRFDHSMPEPRRGLLPRSPDVIIANHERACHDDD